MPRPAFPTVSDHASTLEDLQKTGNYTVITLDKQVEELKAEIDNLKEDNDRKEYIFVKMYEFQHISPK